MGETEKDKKKRNQRRQGTFYLNDVEGTLFFVCMDCLFFEIYRNILR